MTTAYDQEIAELKSALVNTHRDTGWTGLKTVYLCFGDGTGLLVPPVVSYPREIYYHDQQNNYGKAILPSSDLIPYRNNPSVENTEIQVGNPPGWTLGIPAVYGVNTASGFHTLGAQTPAEQVTNALYQSPFIFGGLALPQYPRSQFLGALASGYMKVMGTTGLITSVYPIPASDIGTIYYQTIQVNGTVLSPQSIILDFTDGTNTTVSGTVTGGTTFIQYNASGGGSGSFGPIIVGLGLTGGTIASTGTISLAIPVIVPYGGTGGTILTQHAILIGEGTAPVGFLSPSTARNVAISDGLDWSSRPLVSADLAPDIIQIEVFT